MNKEQALQYFWESFGIPAYDEVSVPDNAKMPYITYSVATSSLGNVVPMTASIWYRSTSWMDVTLKKNDISEAIGYGGKVIPLDGGYVWITRGSMFAQRVSDEDDSVRRYYLQIMCEFLTED